MTDTRYDRRPVLQIDSRGGMNLGRCYNAYCAVVRSNRELKDKDFQALRDAGFLVNGQEFHWTEAPQEQMRYVPEGVDWRGKPYTEVCMPVWVYNVESRVDSSD